MESSFGQFDWLIVAVFGILIGAAELVSRYREAPQRALLTPAALLYVAVNLIVTVAALGLVRTFGWTFGTSGPAGAWMQILVAGFGSMAIFRSSLFNVRVGDQDISVGPNGFLQIVLQASDRAVDRARAQARASDAATIMAGVSFSRAAVSLPAMCGALVGDLSNSSQDVLRRQVGALGESALPEEAKVVVLGLSLMDLVGRDVLKSAVASLGAQIRTGTPLSSYTAPAPTVNPAAAWGRAVAGALDFATGHPGGANGEAKEPVEELPAK